MLNFQCSASVQPMPLALGATAVFNDWKLLLVILPTLDCRNGNKARGGLLLDQGEALLNHLKDTWLCFCLVLGGAGLLPRYSTTLNTSMFGFCSDSSGRMCTSRRRMKEHQGGAF